MYKAQSAPRSGEDQRGNNIRSPPGETARRKEERVPPNPGRGKHKKTDTYQGYQTEGKARILAPNRKPHGHSDRDSTSTQATEKHKEGSQQSQAHITNNLLQRKSVSVHIAQGSTLQMSTEGFTAKAKAKPRANKKMVPDQTQPYLLSTSDASDE